MAKEGSCMYDALVSRRGAMHYIHVPVVKLKRGNKLAALRWQWERVVRVILV
jgi:hypothetical protein